jgi:two-component system phosphate regulon sensor histidine kinase PhoR
VNESERLTRLINTVLDISKIDLGEKHYLMEPINLSSVLQKALAAFEYWMKEQGFKITVDIEPDIRISADGDAIEQAVLNLINNAMKYSDSQKEITVRLHQEENSIYIEVRDRGIGISEPEMPYIFNKYYRAHLTNEKARGGSGLGLTVVKHIVDAHNGRIELTSKVNEGSTFRIILPKTEIYLQEERDLG